MTSPSGREIGTRFRITTMKALVLAFLGVFSGCSHPEGTMHQGNAGVQNLPPAQAASVEMETEGDTDFDEQNEVDEQNVRSLHPDQKIIGYVETFRIVPENVRVDARMDSGATTSSINAINPVTFERDGKRWVRFEVENESNGEKVILERPVVRQVLIRQHVGEPDERFVVELEIFLGERHLKGEFTLANRTSFNYKGLLGRNLLSEGFLVDSGARNILGEPRPASAQH